MGLQQETNEQEIEESKKTTQQADLMAGILLISGQPAYVLIDTVCDPFSRAPHRRWAMGCGRRTRRSLPSVHLFNAG
jgi:hypothetical protein